MACAILRTNRDVVERGARALLEKETLDEAAIRTLATQLQSIESALPPNVRRMN
jgi:cell division protease FtsH